MRYLKFFESVVNVSELKDFCEVYLAYLLDGDFKLHVYEDENLILHRKSKLGYSKKNLKELYTITLCKLDNTKAYSSAIGFNYEQEVADNFIPFLHMLKKEYELVSVSFYDGTNYNTSLKDPNVLDKTVGDILQIVIQVEIKKDK